MTFPKLVYKSPGTYRFPRSKKTYAIKGVADEAQLKAALEKGWFENREEAVGMVVKPVEVVQVVEVPESPEDDNYEPTRAELEQKAKEMGIKFDKRTSDRRLLKLITEGLNNGLD